MIPERIHVLCCIIAAAIILVITWKSPIFTASTAPMKDQTRFPIEAMR